MSAAQNLVDDTGHDKVTEKRMAELIGTTPKALQRKRERNILPLGVWTKIDGRIMYSKRRYDEWLESLWCSHQAWNLSANQSESDSPGTKNVAARRSPSLRPRKGSPQRQVYVLK